MRVSRLVASSVLFLALGFGVLAVATARQWRTTPSGEAREYVKVIDQRSKNELVLVYWVAPETVEGNSPEIEKARSVLREYMLVGVAHARVSPAGQFTFERSGGVLIQTADGKNRQPLSDGALPPVVIGMLSTFQAAFSQALGQFGQGIRWHVFEPKGIGSCQKGAFWVYYAGEQYGYATPIPGCGQATAASPRG
jgi:hypothetical protein